jgi:hypothetical protein
MEYTTAIRINDYLTTSYKDCSWANNINETMIVISLRDIIDNILVNQNLHNLENLHNLAPNYSRNHSITSVKLSLFSNLKQHTDYINSTNMFKSSLFGLLIGANPIFLYERDTTDNSVSLFPDDFVLHTNLLQCMVSEIVICNFDTQYLYHSFFKITITCNNPIVFIKIPKWSDTNTNNDYEFYLDLIKLPNNTYNIIKYTFGMAGLQYGTYMCKDELLHIISTPSTDSIYKHIINKLL